MRQSTQTARHRHWRCARRYPARSYIRRCTPPGAQGPTTRAACRRWCTGRSAGRPHPCYPSLRRICLLYSGYFGDVSFKIKGAGFGTWNLVRRRTSAHARIVRGRRPPIGRGRCSGATSCRAESLIPKASMSVFLIWTNGVFIPLSTIMTFILFFRKVLGKAECRRDMRLQRVVHSTRMYSPGCYMACMEVGRVSTRDSCHSSLNADDGKLCLLLLLLTPPIPDASIDSIF